LPKEKPLTKWEKFRIEKGLPSRRRRSRMVWNEDVKDWVPRWGAYSTKKIDEKLEWAIEAKPGEEGENLFAKRNANKRLEIEK
jgi:regulator of ribosome biosynthesis